MVLAVPVPANGVSGVDVTAAFWNAQVRDAITFLANKPICRMHQLTVQSIANVTNTAVLFDVNDVDSYSGHSTVTNASRYVAQVAGWYRVSGVMAMTTTQTTAPGAGAWCYISKNGTQVSPLIPGAVPSVSTVRIWTAATDLIFLNAGDYLELFVEQAEGAARNTSVATNQYSMMAISWDHV